MKSDQPSTESTEIQSRPAKDELVSKILGTIIALINEVPDSNEEKVVDPETRAREIVANASLKAASYSGALALPPGPLGWLTIVPDLAAVWRIQAQMVSDVAAVFGKKSKLTQESMMFCLFRHAAAQAVRDLVTRVGQRLLVQRASLRLTQTVLRKVGVKITQRIAGKGISRLLPIIGALGVAGYAYYDTGQVGQTAIDFFSKEIEIK